MSSSRAITRPLAQQRTARSPKTHLARALIGAGPGQIVRYENDDRQDLRRRNLRILDRDEARAWRREQAYYARQAGRALRA